MKTAGVYELLGQPSYMYIYRLDAGSDSETFLRDINPYSQFTI